MEDSPQYNTNIPDNYELYLKVADLLVLKALKRDESRYNLQKLSITKSIEKMAQYAKAEWLINFINDVISYFNASEKMVNAYKTRNDYLQKALDTKKLIIELDNNHLTKINFELLDILDQYGYDTTSYFEETFNIANRLSQPEICSL